MPIPVQITFKELDHSDAIEARIHELASRLERVFDRIEMCEVMIEAPHRHQRNGRQYHVRIRLAVPGDDIIVSHDPGADEAHEDPYVAIRDSFRAARRQLDEHVQKMRGEVAQHAMPMPAGENVQR